MLKQKFDEKVKWFKQAIQHPRNVQARVCVYPSVTDSILAFYVDK